jgi:hypothetical protein
LDAGLLSSKTSFPSVLYGAYRDSDRSPAVGYAVGEFEERGSQSGKFTVLDFLNDRQERALTDRAGQGIIR